MGGNSLLHFERLFLLLVSDGHHSYIRPLHNPFNPNIYIWCFSLFLPMVSCTTCQESQPMATPKYETDYKHRWIIKRNRNRLDYSGQKIIHEFEFV